MPYLSNGWEVEILGTANDGSCIVRDFYEDDDGKVIKGEIRLIHPDAICERLPRQHLDKTIGKLKDEIALLRAQKREIEQEIATIKSEHFPLLEKCRHYAQLTRLHDYLDGKITHYVLQRYSTIEIVPLEETRPGGERTGPLRLLSLYGDSKGNLEWQLNYYRDGSGGSQLVYPACSMEEAREIAHRLIVEQLVKSSENPRLELAEQAAAYGVPVPDAYAATLLKRQKQYATKQKTEALAAAKKQDEEMQRIQRLTACTQS